MTFHKNKYSKEGTDQQRWKKSNNYDKSNNAESEIGTGCNQKDESILRKKLILMAVSEILHDFGNAKYCMKCWKLVQI